MVDSKRQGYAIAAVMAVLAAFSWTITMWMQLQHHGTVPTAVGTAMEGVEQRFGVPNSSVFAASTTLTSTGAVDSAHDSYTSLGGLVELFNMQIGEVAPGGVGSGLYGMLIMAVITVFIAGLMVGRTPEYLARRSGPRNEARGKLFPGNRVARLGRYPHRHGVAGPPRQHGQHRHTRPVGGALRIHLRVQNNGSAFAGLSANTVWYNTALGLAMVIARFLPMILVLAFAGSLAPKAIRQSHPGRYPPIGRSSSASSRQ